jgi:hypothetical protein
MPVPDNAELIWNYLIGQGLSVNATAGILGNITQESGGSPTAGVWPSNYGLIQWTPASNYFSSPPSLQAQLPAIIRYIQENGSIADVNAHAPSPSAAALYFSDVYERPNAEFANNPNRMNSATEVAQAAQSGHWPGTAGSVKDLDMSTQSSNGVVSLSVQPGSVSHVQVTTDLGGPGPLELRVVLALPTGPWVQYGGGGSNGNFAVSNGYGNFGLPSQFLGEIGGITLEATQSDRVFSATAY